MLFGLYAIYDFVAEEYGPIIMAKNDGIAIRMFSKSMDGVGEVDDYELKKIGEYDNDVGKVVGYDLPANVEGCEVEE